MDALGGRGAGKEDRLHGRHGCGGDRVRQCVVGGEAVYRREHGRGRGDVRFRRGWAARSLSRQFVFGRGGAGEEAAAGGGALSQSRGREVRRGCGEGGRGRSGLGDGRLGGGLRQRRQGRSVCDLFRPEPALSKSGRWDVRGRDGAGGRGRSAVLDGGGLGGLRSRRRPGSLCGQLRRFPARRSAAVRKRGEVPVSRARRAVRAAGAAGRGRCALSEQWRRDVLRCDAAGEGGRPQWLLWPWRRLDRSRRRWLAGSVRRERHHAQSRLSQQPGWDFHGERVCDGAGGG